MCAIKGNIGKDEIEIKIEANTEKGQTNRQTGRHACRQSHRKKMMANRQTKDFKGQNEEAKEDIRVKESAM